MGHLADDLDRLLEGAHLKQMRYLSIDSLAALERLPWQGFVRQILEMKRAAPRRGDL